jgi:hypothetical protein
MQMMTEIRQERRQTRSELLAEALRLAFESVAQGFDLSHLVLCDSAGFPFAGVGNEKDVEALAAFAPVLHRSGEPSSRYRVMESLSDCVFAAETGRVSLQSFDCSGTTFLVCGVGRRGATKDVGVFRAITAARRILGR